MTEVALWVVVGLAAWVTVWTGVCQLLGFPWRALERAYPHRDLDDGEVLKRRSGTLNGINYNFVLRMTLGHRHLHLQVAAPFRFGHPPVSIPWSEIEVERFRRFGFRGALLRFSSSTSSWLKLRGGTLDAVVDWGRDRGLMLMESDS